MDGIPELSISEDEDLISSDNFTCVFPECVHLEFTTMEDFFDHICLHFPIPNSS